MAQPCASIPARSRSLSRSCDPLRPAAPGHRLSAWFHPQRLSRGRWLKGIDLRDCGSGSTGATNVLRNVGKGPALVVFLVDVGKGALAVLAKGVGLNDWVQVLAGLAALAGHIWPVWLGWKGGGGLDLVSLAWPGRWGWPASAYSWP